MAHHIACGIEPNVSGCCSCSTIYKADAASVSTINIIKNVPIRLLRSSYKTFNSTSREEKYRVSLNTLNSLNILKKRKSRPGNSSVKIDGKKANKSIIAIGRVTWRNRLAKLLVCTSMVWASCEVVFASTQTQTRVMYSRAKIKQETYSMTLKI